MQAMATLETLGRAQAGAAGTSSARTWIPPELGRQLQPQLQSVFETGRRPDRRNTFQTDRGGGLSSTSSVPCTG